MIIAYLDATMIKSHSTSDLFSDNEVINQKHIK